MLRRIDGKPFSGQLVYRRSEWGLDVEPRPSGGVSSLQLNEVQIEVDEEGRLLYVWGYCPHESWQPATLDAPAATPGRLQYVGWTIVRGVSIQLNPDKGWAVGYDSSSQWLCLGDASARAEMIGFAPDAVAALNEKKKLVALWLHPAVRE
jgi:hypothetical protein